MAKKTIVRWVIGYRQDGNFRGLYTGQWLTRKDAIEGHTKPNNWDWRKRKRRGDFVTKAKIIYEEPK